MYSRILSQKGTTTLHIMAILLIMGILMVGGYTLSVFGFTKTKAYYIGREADNRAAALQASPTTGAAKPKETMTPLGFAEMSDTRIWTHVKISDSLFAITGDKISERVCHRLTEMSSEHREGFYVNCSDALIGEVKDCTPSFGRADLCMKDSLNLATFVYKTSARKVKVTNWDGEFVYKPNEDTEIVEPTDIEQECPPEAPYVVRKGLKKICCPKKNMTICGEECCEAGAPCCGDEVCCVGGLCCGDVCYTECNTYTPGMLPRSYERNCECWCDETRGFKRYPIDGVCVCDDPLASYDAEKDKCDNGGSGYEPTETPCVEGHAPENPEVIRCCREGENLSVSYRNYEESKEETGNMFCCEATEEEAEKKYVYFDYSTGSCERKDICPHNYDGIAFVLDNSGSMVNYPKTGKKRLETLKDALKGVADMDILTEEINVGIYTFADVATGTKLKYGPYSKTSFESAVSGLSSKSCDCTCVGCGMRYGYAETYGKGKTPLMVLLTDGSSYCYPTNSNGSRSCSYYVNCTMVSSTQAECDINRNCNMTTPEVGLGLKQNCTNLFRMVVFGFDYESADLDALARYGGQREAEYATAGSLAHQLKAIAQEFDCIPRENEATCQKGCPKNAQFSTSVKDNTGATGVCVCNTPNYYLKENFSGKYSISCAPCPAGTYRKSGTNYCSACPNGQTSNGLGGNCTAQ